MKILKKVGHRRRLLLRKAGCSSLSPVWSYGRTWPRNRATGMLVSSSVVHSVNVHAKQSKRRWRRWTDADLKHTLMTGVPVNLSQYKLGRRWHHTNILGNFFHNNYFRGAK